MGGAWFFGYKARAIFVAIALPIVLFCLGVGELWRCVRTLFPAATVTFQQASTEGLAGRGYIRLTGVEPGVDRAVVMNSIRRDRSGAVEERRMDSVFLPAESAEEGVNAQDRYHVLIWIPQATSVPEAGQLLRGAMPDEGELLCFVECAFPELNPGYHQAIKHLAGARAENCWVVKIWRPSWRKGLGLTLASAIIPGLFVIWRIRKPLYED